MGSNCRKGFLGYDESMDEFPGFSALFSIGYVSDREFRGDFDSGDCFRLTRGEEQPSEAITLTHAMGRGIPRRVVFATSPYAIVLHGEVVSTLRERGVSGWSTYPVIVVDKSGSRHDDYFGLSITGRCGPVSNRRSRAVEKHVGWKRSFHA
jgi:hypothetical protein